LLCLFFSKKVAINFQVTYKYLKRIESIKERLKKEGKNWKDATFEELDRYWDEAKAKKGS